MQPTMRPLGADRVGPADGSHRAGSWSARRWRRVAALSAVFGAMAPATACGGGGSLASFCPPLEFVGAVVDVNPPTRTSMTGDRQCNYIFGAEVQRDPDRTEAWAWVTWYPDTATGRDSFDFVPTDDRPARDLDGYTMCSRAEWPFAVDAFDARPQSDRGPVCDWADAILEISQDHLTMD